MSTFQAPCANCRTETSHRVLKSHVVLHSEEVDHDSVSGETWEDKDTYQIIECAGCGRISFAHSTPNPGFGASDDLDDEWARVAYYVDYYPSPVSREKPQWLETLRIAFGAPGSDIPNNLREMFLEVYKALSGGQHRLALMGIRALLEQVMIIKVGDQGSFAKNLEVFCERGFASRVQRDALSAVLDAGHASMHRMYKPTEEDLNTALDIAEGIFAAIYVHSDAAGDLTGRVPKRPPTGKVIPWGRRRRRPDDHGDDASSDQKE